MITEIEHPEPQTVLIWLSRGNWDGLITQRRITGGGQIPCSVISAQMIGPTSIELTLQGDKKTILLVLDVGTLIATFSIVGTAIYPGPDWFIAKCRSIRSRLWSEFSFENRDKVDDEAEALDQPDVNDDFDWLFDPRNDT